MQAGEHSGAQLNPNYGSEAVRSSLLCTTLRRGATYATILISLLK